MGTWRIMKDLKAIISSMNRKNPKCAMKLYRSRAVITDGCFQKILWLLKGSKGGNEGNNYWDSQEKDDGSMG